MFFALNRKHVAEYPQLAVFSFDQIARDIHLFGQFEKDELNFLKSKLFPALPKNSDCLDVGANIGKHSVAFSSYFSSVWAFEPNPRTYQLLKINSTLANNIVPLNLGASKMRQSRNAVQDMSNIGGSRICAEQAECLDDPRSVSADRIVFDLDRLDDVAEVKDLRRISFVKIDVEGHENAAIAGMTNILRTNRPIVALEILGSEIVDGSAAALNSLKGISYQHFYTLQEDGIIGGMPPFGRRLTRAMCAIFLGKRLNKASQIIPIKQLRQGVNYRMVLCSMDPTVLSQ